MASALDALDAREPAAGGARGAARMGPLRPLRRARRAGDRPRPRLARGPNARPSPPTTRASSPTLDAAGLLDGDPPLRADPGGVRPDHELRRPALLPEHHRPGARQVLRRPPDRAHRPHRRRSSSSPSSSTASTTPASTRSLAAERRARPLQAGARPHPQDEALPALRRAGEVPARPVGGRRRRLEPALRRDDGRARVRGRRRDAAARGDARTCSPTRTAPGARPAPRRWRRSSRRGCRSSPASPTRSPRRRRSRTAGASCRRRRPARHLANDVEPEVVQALRDAVVAAYPRLSHRYYALKAQLARPRQARGLGPQRAAAAARTTARSPGTRRAPPCSTPMPASTRAWPSSPSRSSTRAGSTRP